MTPEEIRRKQEEIRSHNDAILSKLDFATLLVEYQHGERTTGRGNVFINLVCLLLYLRRTDKRAWPHTWIVTELGEPDRTEEADEHIGMHYRMKYPECKCEREHWAELRLKHGHLVGFSTY